MVQGFIHMSITCRDLDRSIAFHEALSLEVISRLGEVTEPSIGQASGCRNSPQGGVSRRTGRRQRLIHHLQRKPFGICYLESWPGQ